MNRGIRVLLLCMGCTGLGAGGLTWAGDRIPIVDEGGIRGQWAVDGTLAAPGVPERFARRGDNACVAMGYAINEDGSTSDFSLLKSWSSSGSDEPASSEYWQDLLNASAAAVSQWKFKARPEVRKVTATYTVVTMTFIGGSAMDVAELRGHCGISNLQAFIERDRARQFQTGTIQKSDLERFRRDTNASRTMVANPGIQRTR